MSTTFVMCMNCGCNEEDVKVLKCHGCNKTFCDVCANHGFISTRCPNCNSEGTKLGYIV